MLLAGCIGTLPGQTQETGPASGEPASQAHEISERTPQEPRERAENTLTIVLELTPESPERIDVRDLFVSPLPGGETSFVTETTSLAPGERVPMARLTVPDGLAVSEMRVTLRLTDGIGEALLSVGIGAWNGEADVTQSIYLTMEEPGELRASQVVGPETARSVDANAEPMYGWMVWPDGYRDPIGTFPYTIHVPEAYPLLTSSQGVSFEITDADGPVEWTYDGETISTEDSVEIDAEPGRHVLRVTIGDHSHVLRPRADLDQRFEDVAPVGTLEARKLLDGINARAHPFEIGESNLWTTVEVGPRGDDSFAADLDLYLADADGELIAEAVSEHPTEHIELRHPLEPGEYTLWVYNARGASVAYTAFVHVDY